MAHTVTAQEGRSVTLAEWKTLVLPDDVRYELVEGRLVAMPGASRIHNNLARRLANLLEGALPRETWEVISPGVEVPIPAKRGATRRIPDVSVIRKSAYDADPYDNEAAVSDTLLVVEVVSPGDPKRDLVLKREEYARAGIPHYWIFDIRKDYKGPWATVLTLVDGQYQEQSLLNADGSIHVNGPVSVRFALDDLVG